MRVKTLPIFLAFFLMGLADAMGPMSDGVRKQYQLSNGMAAGCKLERSGFPGSGRKLCVSFGDLDEDWPGKAGSYS